MKTAQLLANPKAAHQVHWAGAFAEGLKRHGWSVTIDHNQKPCDLLVLWGVRRVFEIELQKRNGGEVCVLERGYLGDRMKWTSVSFGGGLNGRGRFFGPFGDGDRWRRHFADLERPWRSLRGRYALILGQVPTDMSLKGINAPRVWAEAARALTSQGHSVRFRPHPLAPGVGVPGVMRDPSGTLEEALRGACMALAINSNSSVDSVLAGVPTVTLDEGAMAWDVTDHEVRYPKTYDRTSWCHQIAWKQWSSEEMASGYCWEMAGRQHAMG